MNGNRRREDRRQVVGKNLESLRKLTDHLTTLPGMIDYKFDHTVDYSTNGGGKILGFFLYNEPTVSVQRVFMEKGTKFPKHFHTSVEYGVVYSGSMEVTHGGETRLYKTGECMVFPPNEEHRGVVTEDTWVIYIAVPTAEGYPE